MRSKKLPPNFVDLSRTNPKRAKLIQDVIDPQLKRRWSFGLTSLKRLTTAQQLELVAVLVILALVSVGLITSPTNPLPASLKSQVNFVVLYPSNYRIDPSSWRYSASQQTLTFSVSNNGQTVVFTEQKTPLAFQNDLAAYSRFIGGLRPSANFNATLGKVSLVQFVTANDFQPQGQTGILNSKGTLVLAHPTHHLSDAQWLSLFNGLKTS